MSGSVDPGVVAANGADQGGRRLIEFSQGHVFVNLAAHLFPVPGKFLFAGIFVELGVLLHKAFKQVEIFQQLLFAEGVFECPILADAKPGVTAIRFPRNEETVHLAIGIGLELQLVHAVMVGE